MPRILHPLSLADLAAIATAPSNARPVELAHQLGRPYETVHKAMQRIREAGGWSTPLQWRPCTECGQLLASSRVWRRTAHKACERARVVRKARERRLQRPGQSTPYVHAWRQRNPEDNALLREQEKAKRRERWPDLPEELRNAMLARAHAADQRDYPLTLEEANRSGDRWTEEEDGTILARLRDPARDVALALGRTLWAVRNRRVRLRRLRTKTVSAGGGAPRVAPAGKRTTLDLTARKDG